MDNILVEKAIKTRLICAVRNCGRPLAREQMRVVCPRGHSFDIARSGYINLLQPQERRSKEPGDAARAVIARRRLHDAGVTTPVLRGIQETVGVTARDVLLDAGCCEGFYSGSLSQETGCEAHGIDISAPAIDAAARRYPECEWVVANADRFIPYADNSFSLILSITARMNSAEFHRVLGKDGRLLVAIAAPDDLIELRGAGRDRVARTVETFSGDFQFAAHRRVTVTASLNASSVEDLLLSIYRPLRAKSIAAMDVTFSLDLLLFTNTKEG
jgi:23S rRNA (guanine745-N1)-methyltransferase